MPVESVRRVLLEMSAMDRRELGSRVNGILDHLAKLDYLPQLRAWNESGWRRSIQNQRKEIDRLLDDKPSLKLDLTQTLVDDEYVKVLRSLLNDFPQSFFPAQCPYRVSDVYPDFRRS